MELKLLFGVMKTSYYRNNPTNSAIFSSKMPPCGCEPLIYGSARCTHLAQTATATILIPQATQRATYPRNRLGNAPGTANAAPQTEYAMGLGAFENPTHHPLDVLNQELCSRSKLTHAARTRNRPWWPAKVRGNL